MTNNAPKTELERGEARPDAIIVDDLVAGAPQYLDDGYIRIVDWGKQQGSSVQFVWIREDGEFEMQPIPESVAQYYRDRGWTHERTCETCDFFIHERCAMENSETPWNHLWPACGLYAPTTESVREGEARAAAGMQDYIKRTNT